MKVFPDAQSHLVHNDCFHKVAHLYEDESRLKMVFLLRPRDSLECETDFET